MNAPVVLFVYNRPRHVACTIEALKNNELSITSDLIVFSDGASNSKDEIKVEKVRCLLENISGFRSVTIHRHNSNHGLAMSIIEGVTQILVEYDRVIVLEDDMVTSPFF